jgi:hypothetical protein
MYDCALISKCDPDINPSVMDGDKKKIIFHLPKDPRKRTMDPALLRTCKKIHREASPILYPGNTFHVTDPNSMLMRQIGPVNTTYLKTLYVWVAWRISGPWLGLFCTLAQKATGLRKVVIAWGAGYEFL